MVPDTFYLFHRNPSTVRLPLISLATLLSYEWVTILIVGSMSDDPNFQANMFVHLKHQLLVKTQNQSHRRGVMERFTFDSMRYTTINGEMLKHLQQKGSKKGKLKLHIFLREKVNIVKGKQSITFLASLSLHLETPSNGLQ